MCSELVKGWGIILVEQRLRSITKDERINLGLGGFGFGKGGLVITTRSIKISIDNISIIVSIHMK